ncbi:MAG TPA: S1/P1 nuclease, partial [Longimicrobium sp.]
QRIAARHPLSRMRGQIEPGEFEEWSREGFRIAQRVAYTGVTRDQAAPPSYRRHAWSAAEGRVALAGYRLADLLNRTLGA